MALYIYDNKNLGYLHILQAETMSLSRVRTVVSTNWLREQISTNVQKQASKKLRILDTSFVMDRHADSYNEGYKKGHIPQSVHFDLYKCTPEKPGITVGWPDVNCFTDYVQSLGIWPETHVVAYDRFLPLSAYRTWWQFRAFGHRNISVLDGGLKKWLDDGFELTTEEPEFERSDFVPKLDKNLFRTFEDILENLKSKKEQLVEARPMDHPTMIDEEVDVSKIFISLKALKTMITSKLNIFCPFHQKNYHINRNTCFLETRHLFQTKLLYINTIPQKR
ncbi:thiosulfate sulfurtransferase-like isoform X2 [Mercenaria mercenaria]|uniref:thiosulfate sulfurtransferase-like isoform X2 n=1 Tax=Mercenaria mercenaria TaxID=6596 RepID=UPI00234F1DEC|nr:thiosulfate sulfurtransferase-like isoform X2 [Mercenaria mercenaria]